MVRSGQGHNGNGVDAHALHTLHEKRITGVLCGVEGEKGLLVLPDPTCWGIVQGKFVGWGRFHVPASLEDAEAHGVIRGVVKNQAEKIELQDGMEAFGKFVKERLRIVLLRDGFADFQQGLELPAGRIERRGGTRFGRRILRFRHENENSTRFGGVTRKCHGVSQIILDERGVERRAACRGICVYSGHSKGNGFADALRGERGRPLAELRTVLVRLEIAWRPATEEELRIIDEILTRGKA